MFKRFPFVALLLCMALAPLTAFAAPTDAGSTDPAPVDTGSGPDAVGPSADTTSTTSFSANPCWDEKCPTETATCKASAACVAAAAKGDLKDADYSALANCGWKACNDPSKGSCVGKCDKWDNAWPCNCDSACKDIGDCCADIATACPAAPATPGSCAKSDCSPNSQGVDSTGAAAKCYCDTTCKTNNPPDCCADYDTTCGKGGPTTCTPQCTGKKCGPDGCNTGGTCGVCDKGAVCDNAGQCLGGTAPKADAGGTGTDTSVPTGGLDAAGGADAGTTIIYTSAPAKSGCSAGGSPVAPGSLALLMLGLGLAVVLRRRQA